VFAKTKDHCIGKTKWHNFLSCY